MICQIAGFMSFGSLEKERENAKQGGGGFFACLLYDVLYHSLFDRENKCQIARVRWSVFRGFCSFVWTGNSRVRARLKQTFCCSVMLVFLRLLSFFLTVFF